MLQNKTLKLLDLSNNEIDNNGAKMLSALIATHARNRDEEVWVASIRGDQPEVDIDFLGNLNLATITNKEFAI